MTGRLVRIAILASGAGTNAQAVIDAAARGDIPVEVAIVASDRPGAMVLDRATAAGIETLSWDARVLGRDRFEQRLVAALDARGVQLVVLAGFMRLLGPTFLTAFEGRTLNIHPSLLPDFPGADAVGQALAAGVPFTGVTVHWIDAGMDTGPVIEQQRVAIHATDTRELLLDRIHRVEHAMYPVVVGSVAQALLDPDSEPQLHLAGAAS